MSTMKTQSLLPGKNIQAYQQNMLAFLSEVHPLVMKGSIQSVKNSVNSALKLTADGSKETSGKLFWAIHECWPYVHWDHADPAPEDRKQLINRYQEIRLLGVNPFARSDLHIEGEESFFVLFSEQEARSELSAGLPGGFWSNEDGWVDIESATRFELNESIPMDRIAHMTPGDVQALSLPLARAHDLNLKERYDWEDQTLKHSSPKP